MADQNALEGRLYYLLREVRDSNAVPEELTDEVEEALALYELNSPDH